MSNASKSDEITALFVLWSLLQPKDTLHFDIFTMGVVFGAQLQATAPLEGTTLSNILLTTISDGDEPFSTRFASMPSSYVETVESFRKGDV